MINPAFEILNQRGTPMFFSDIFANRPAAGVVGRIFISTDTLVLYRDTGTTWDEISGSTFSGSLAAGQVAFGSAANTIAGSNNLFWNNANSRLGINQTSPADSLDINGGQRISVNSGSTAKLSLYTGILNNTASTSPSFIEFWQRSNRTISMGLQTNSRFVINNNFDFTGSELFTIFTTSNVGIGTGATDSGHRFQVNGQTELRTTAVQYQLRLTDQNGFKWDLFAVANVTNTDLRFVDTGGAQRVTFFNGGNVSIGNNNNDARLSVSGSTILNGNSTFGTLTTGTGMYWDNSNNRLGVCIAPATKVHIYQSNGPEVRVTSNDGFISRIGLYHDANGDNFGSWIRNNGGNRYLEFGHKNSTVDTAAQLSITHLGNVLVNTTTDLGGAFQVNGSSYFSNSVQIGSGVNVPNGSNALTVVGYGSFTFNFNNSTGFTFSNVLLNDGYLSLGGSGSNRYIGCISEADVFFHSGQYTPTASYGRIRFGTTNNNRVISRELVIFDMSNLVMSLGTTTYLSSSKLTIGGSVTAASAIGRGTLLNATIVASANNDVLVGLDLNPTFTNGAFTGVTNAALRWNNNSGWGLYGAGTAANYIAGDLQVGSTTQTGLAGKLQVTGFSYFADTRTYSTGTIQSATFDKQLTIPNGTTVSSGVGVASMIAGGITYFGGSVTVPNTSPMATMIGNAGYQFNAAGSTITINQATGLRAATQLFLYNGFQGSNSGTVTDMSTMTLGGYFNANSGSITPVITNAYQLLINNIDDYSHTFTFTNRWGIYQNGALDRNYFAGNIMLNSTTDSGHRLQVTGSIRVNGQRSGTAGGASGQHLIINCDGIDYKIALLNP